ncbi:NVEALA domain-containing protein [Proteiniphilum sp. X52]|uniref:NVEALA domain-containing protein n=1 Tax=Proteiniphilum sp. X52 TaxID=2382159 RepID=UPI000F0A4F21|nr:NVEALA domain-containing protein [Proteiniphilum sp. X52]RNC63302.1 hypothetical protein D7D25_17265 [Proteiniphilum sp. X52]
MKKRVLSGLFALALLVAVGYGVSQTMKSEANLSDLALTNVEALAQNENGGGNGPCYTFQSSSTDRIVCYGGYTYITTYSFSCNGSNGSCSGTIGSTGTDCNGNPFDSRETITRKC